MQLLSTESAEISQVIASKQVSEIPLNGRQWQQLIALSAGVNPGAPGETGSPNPVNVNGQRTKANLFMVDGISTTSSAQGRGNNFNIPLEAVREFSVQAGAYSAEYGDVAGGVINLESKSGTNNWHGSLFEFFRNDRMDAANFFANATLQPKNPLRYNQFGGSVGGPIRHEKTFVFGDYQGTITRNASPMVTSVPLDQQRLGDFSNLRANGAPVPIYDPFGASLARTPFPNNTIPLTSIDPAAANITALLPHPNQFDATGQPLPFNNYAVTRSNTSNVHSFDIRVDHQFSPNNTLFVRESFQNTYAVTPSLFGLPLGGPPTGAGTTLARNQNAGIGHVYQFTPALINEIRIGLNRQTTSLTQEDYGQNLSQQFGIPGVNRSPQTSGLSTLVVSGLFSLGGSILTPLRVATTNWNFSDRVIWMKGRHTFRFGVDYQYELGSTGYLVFGRGNYTFLNLTTSTLVGPAGGNAFASFLMGAPFQVLRDEFPPGMVGTHFLPLRLLRAGRFQDHLEADAEYRRALRHHAVSAGEVRSAFQFRSGHANHADRRAEHERTAAGDRLQGSGAARRPGLCSRFQNCDSRGLWNRIRGSIGQRQRSEQQRIQHTVLLPQQHHAVSVHGSHVHAQQLASGAGGPFAFGADRRSTLSHAQRSATNTRRRGASACRRDSAIP